MDSYTPTIKSSPCFTIYLVPSPTSNPRSSLTSSQSSPCHYRSSHSCRLFPLETRLLHLTIDYEGIRIKSDHLHLPSGLCLRLPKRPSYILSRCPRRSRDGGTSETGFPAWLPHEFASSRLRLMNDEAVNVLSTLIAAHSSLPISASRGVHHICQEAGRGRQFHGGDSGTSCSRSFYINC